MQSRRFRIIIVIIFLFTTSLIVVLQYNANKNIDELVAGNESLLSEFKMRSHLQELQNDLLLLDNNVRSIIIGKESKDVNVELAVSKVKASVKELGELLVTDSSKHLWNELNALTNEKIQFNYRVLDSLRNSGKQAAEELIKQQKSNELSDAITLVSTKLDLARQTDLEKIIRETDTNSLDAKSLQALLAITAVIIVMFTLWYVVSRIRKQHEMINRLNESERKVKEAALVKEHFIANMSHEIRTPLNAIIGFTGLLKKQTLEAPASEYVNAINTSGENLLSIVNEVLDLSKIEAGMMRIERVAINLNELLQSVFSMFKPKASEKHLAFTLNIHHELPANVMGDPVRITQVLANLLSNAIKFTANGMVKMDVNGHINEDKFQLQVKVSDTGIGIPGPIKQHIFERFTQADEDTTRKYGGTGLGLSIVKQIIELLNGSIHVESQPDIGSVFTVIIPLEIVPDLILVNTDIKAPQATVSPVGTANILVVEDNPMNQSLVVHLLGDMEYKTSIANNGNEAIQALENFHFDLILMDIQMPDMDGYTTAQYIRQHLKLTTPIIAMTAHAFAGEKEKCIGYGMNDYLPKPINEQALKTMVAHYLQPILSPGKNGKTPPGYIDLEYLQQLANGNHDFRNNILQQFTVQAPEEISLLKKAYDGNDFTNAKKLAHNLKTTISFLGLEQHLMHDIELLELACVKHEFDIHTDIATSHIYEVCNYAVEEAQKLLLASASA